MGGWRGALGTGKLATVAGRQAVECLALFGLELMLGFFVTWSKLFILFQFSCVEMKITLIATYQFL